MFLKILYFFAFFNVVNSGLTTPTRRPLRPTNDPVQILCLACLCDGISNCSTLRTSEPDAQGGRGPFRITRDYWVEGGRPLMPADKCKDEQTAYGNCAQEVYCAASAVQGYMAKHKMDCNGDQLIDCDDYAAIHFLGPNSCREKIKHENFLRRYPKCKSAIRESMKVKF